MPRRLPWLLLAWLTTCLGGLAQLAPIDLSREPVVPPLALLEPETGPTSLNSSGPRIRLFRIQPGFLSELRWLEMDEPPPDDLEPDVDWLALSIGSDNPYFEMRQRGDPGGVGFARVHTQVQIWESERTACSLGLQAFTPLGRESDGLADRDGPTVLSPALALYHLLEDGRAVQAYIGKNVPLMNSSAQPLRRLLQCGVAVQQPLFSLETDPLSGLYVSLGALGLLQRERMRGVEVLPGLHWQPDSTWWLSAGYVLPLGAIRREMIPGWQVTCSWQY